MFAKAREAPSVVSTRVLRTHRLNEVETFRLHGRIKTIDNEIQTNYSQISDEIDGVRKNLVRIKKLKNNLSVSVERRKLLRQYGVFVIPSSSLDDDEGVILRRKDGKKFVIKGKECYDGEVIRRCIDINFDSSKHSIVDADNESDEDEDSELAGYDDPQFDKKRILHYRIIVPPIHPGSRRNFKDYEELPKEDELEFVELPPTGSFMDNLRGSPLTRIRSAPTCKESKQNKRHSKSELSFFNSRASDVQVENEGVESGTIEPTLVEALDNLSTIATTITPDGEKKDKYLQSTAVPAIKPHSRAHSPKTLDKKGEKSTREIAEENDQSNDGKVEHGKSPTNKSEFLTLPGSHNALSRTQSADGVRKPKVTARRLSVDDRRKTKDLRKHFSSEDNLKKKSVAKNENDYGVDNSNLQMGLPEEFEKLPISVNKVSSNDDGKPRKLLARRKSMDEELKMQINKQEQEISVEVTDELAEESDVLTVETLDLELLPEDVCWTQMITRTTLASHEDNFHDKKPSRRKSEVRTNRTLLFAKQSDERSVASFASHRKRTDSFNSTANSQIVSKGRRKSTASHLGSDTERRVRRESHNDIIYDARPDKALSKGYSTMQMTIGGKQVKICVPKFSKDDVIDRARAKSAAQMADERTRGHTTVKQQKQIKQTT